MSRRIARRSLFVISLLALGCNGGSGDSGGSQPGFDGGTGLGMGECSGMCGTAGCGTCPSVDMVDGGGFQIDATEVDNGQYALLLEVEFDQEILPSGCDWKSSFEPEGWAADADPMLPVVGVDWCDAMVFCTWAEKAGGDGNTECRRRGGSRHSDGDNLRCAVNSTRARGERDNAVGFRCCTG